MHKKLRIIELTSESRRYDNIKYSERLSCGRIKALNLADLTCISLLCVKALQHNQEFMAGMRGSSLSFMEPCTVSFCTERCKVP